MAHGARNAVWLGKLGKHYGVSAAETYLDIEDPYWKFQIDFACACAYWQDENHQYQESKKIAGKESYDIGRELDRYRKQLSER
jgi:hypothetical protein